MSLLILQQLLAAEGERQHNMFPAFELAQTLSKFNPETSEAAKSTSVQSSAPSTSPSLDPMSLLESLAPQSPRHGSDLDPAALESFFGLGLQSYQHVPLPQTSPSDTSSVTQAGTDWSGKDWEQWIQMSSLPQEQIVW